MAEHDSEPARIFEIVQPPEDLVVGFCDVELVRITPGGRAFVLGVPVALDKARAALKALSPTPEGANSPCPRCREPVTVTRCTSEHARHYGGWDVACRPCDVAYESSPFKGPAELIARDLGKFCREAERAYRAWEASDGQ